MIMHKLGFHEKWVALIILACIHTQKCRIFVNKFHLVKRPANKLKFFQQFLLVTVDKCHKVRADPSSDLNPQDMHRWDIGLV
jgi:hypothetical protein